MAKMQEERQCKIGSLRSKVRKKILTFIKSSNKSGPTDGKTTNGFKSFAFT
jgi:hypothetical protein